MTDKLSNRLSALAEKATKGPWAVEILQCGSVAVGLARPDGSLDAVYDFHSMGDEHTEAAKQSVANRAHLIVDLVNALPTIISALQEKDL